MTPSKQAEGRALVSTKSAQPLTVVPAGITDPVEAARAELKAALAALEIKGNIPRRVQKASIRAADKGKAFANEKPALAIAAVVGAAVVIGGAVWGIARLIAR